jgi:ATP-dependent Clp protease ATP-binding subunit ClpA/ATP-dependent Clp protease ATP-binding subunit ClpC
MNVSVIVYQRRLSHGALEWTTVGLGEIGFVRRRAGSPVKLQQLVIDELRRRIEKLPPRELPIFSLRRGTRLERVRVELDVRDDLGKRRPSGVMPLIVAPYAATDDDTLEIAYHPARPADWFPVRAGTSLATQAAQAFSRALRGEPDGEIESLWSDAKDSLRVIAFSARPKSLLDELPKRQRGPFDDLDKEPLQQARGAGGSAKLLRTLGTDLTAQAAEGVLALGEPREPHRERLQQLLCGPRVRPTLVVGAPGTGKSTLLARAVGDRLIADDWPSHRNLDRVREVFRLSGKRLIAGMSHVGEWEERCLGLVAEAKRRRAILWIDDVHLFGRLGRARDSDRDFASLFRGPISRGEIAILGEVTPEQLRVLEEDAPAFAACFTRVLVEEATPEETFRLALAEVRALERTHHVELSPHALRTALDTGTALLSSRARPGNALELLRSLARELAGSAEAVRPIGTAEVLAVLSARTGLPRVLLEPNSPLDLAQVRAELAARVIGQPEAVAHAVDLIARLKSGLVEPRRPASVMLFTGPTGTGKTELAKATAAWLYGEEGRLTRFDMSELSGPEAPSRLIGDAWEPRGLLTRAVQEQPFSVVLLDEIEKAHPSVLHLLLQLFDDGRLTDAAGVTASFRHAVVIMTSNLGAQAKASVGFSEADGARRADVARAVREFFPPELFNRIDRVVPFDALSRPVALAVAERELAKLLARRGLVDRSLFVDLHPAALARVVDEAFGRDGARGLKRAIEERIGGPIAEHVAASAGAALQIVRAFDGGPDGGRGVRLEVERLVEAEPVSASYALEPLLSASNEQLRAALEEVPDMLRALEGSARLADLATDLRAHLATRARAPGGTDVEGLDDAIYNLDWMRHRVRAFREQIEALVVPPDPHELLERRLVARVDSPDPEARRSRLRAFSGGVPGAPVARRAELLNALAEAQFLRRAVTDVRDPTQHAVSIELLRVTSRRADVSPASARAEPSDLAGVLALAFSGARGALDDFALVYDEGGDVAAGRGRAALMDALYRPCLRATLHVVGPCVLDFFALEAGCHVLTSAAGVPEVVAVRVSPCAPGDTARAVLASRLAARQAWLAATAAGARVDDPDRLPPLVRRLRVAPGSAHDFVVEVEDYAMSWARTARVARVPEALEELWMVRTSREGAPLSMRAAVPESREVSPASHEDPQRRGEGRR